MLDVNTWTTAALVSAWGHYGSSLSYSVYYYIKLFKLKHGLSDISGEEREQKMRYYKQEHKRYHDFGSRCFWVGCGMGAIKISHLIIDAVYNQEITSVDDVHAVISENQCLGIK